MFFFGAKEVKVEDKEAPSGTGRYSVICRRCWRPSLKSAGVRWGRQELEWRTFFFYR